MSKHKSASRRFYILTCTIMNQLGVAMGVAEIKARDEQPELFTAMVNEQEKLTKGNIPNVKNNPIT